MKNGVLHRARDTARFTAPSTPVSNPRATTLQQQKQETAMKLGAALAEIMKREGIEVLCGDIEVHQLFEGSLQNGV